MTGRRMPTRQALEAEVRRYVPTFVLALRADELPPGTPVPDDWVALLRAQRDGAATAPAGWDQLADELPFVQRYLDEALCGVAVLVEPGARVSLLYVTTSDGGASIDCYRGWPPRAAPAPAAPEARAWAALPHALRTFYTTVHDGWAELASGAGGPARSSEWGRLSDPDWELDADAVAMLPCEPADVVLVFSNAAGDYLGLDTAHPSWDGVGQGIIWYHDAQTESEVGQDFWSVLDAWFSIFVEEVDGIAL